MNKFLININGEIFNEETAKISIFDRGFLYGDSVYEATRTFNRITFRINQHLDRLFASALKIEMIPTLSSLEILKAIEQTVEASPHQNTSLRIILTRGTNSDLGLDPQLSSSNNLIIISKAILPNPAWWLSLGLSMVFYHKKLSKDKGSLSKSGNYQDNILAYKEALRKKAYDAIMINHEGHVTEGTTSNIWMVKDGIIYTPPLQDGVLSGLTRQNLFEMSKSNKGTIKQKFVIEEKSLTKNDLLSADECFISSTTRNLVPVTKIEGQAIGDGAPGKMTLMLLDAYLEFVGLQLNF